MKIIDNHNSWRSTGGAVFVNTGYAGGAYFIFKGNPSLVKIWVAGHAVYLRNQTYHGAFVTRKHLDYFAKGRRASLKMAHVTFTVYNEDDLESAFARASQAAAMPGGFVRFLQEESGNDRGAEDRLVPQASFTDSTTSSSSLFSPLSSAPARDGNPQEGEAASGKTPTWVKVPGPGVDVMIPPSPVDLKTDNIFIADSLDQCKLCGIRPGMSDVRNGWDKRISWIMIESYLKVFFFLFYERSDGR